MRASPGGKQYPGVGLNLLFFSTQRHGNKSLRLSVTLSRGIDWERPGPCAILTKVHVREPSLGAASREKAHLARSLETQLLSEGECPPRPSTKVTGAVTRLR